MAQKITMTEYLHELQDYGEGVSLEVRVLSISAENVVIRPEIHFGGHIIWKGLDFKLEEDESLAMHQFTMTDESYLISQDPVSLGEHYGKDQEM